MRTFGFMLSERMFMRSICAPLALVCGVGGVVGSCTPDTSNSTEKECGDVRSSKRVKKVIPVKNSVAKKDGSSPLKGDLKEGSADFERAGKQDVVISDNVNSAVAGSGETKSSGGAVAEESSAASKNVALTSEDKDKIIKILLGQQSAKGGQTTEVKSKKKSESVADYFNKFGSVGAFVYAIYGAFDMLRGGSTLKDVATTANAVLGLSTFGAAAISKF